MLNCFLSAHKQKRKQDLPLLVFWSSCTAASCPEIMRHINIQRYRPSTSYSPTQINQWLLPSCCFSSSFTWSSLAAILSWSEFSFCWVTASSEAWAEETDKNWNHVESENQPNNTSLIAGYKGRARHCHTVILHQQFLSHVLNSSHPGLHGWNRQTSFKLS